MNYSISNCTYKVVVPIFNFLLTIKKQGKFQEL